MLITVLTLVRHLSLSRARAVCSTLYHHVSLRSILILSSHPLQVSSDFPSETLLISCPYKCHMPCRSLSFEHRNSNWWGVRIILSFVIVSSSLVSCLLGLNSLFSNACFSWKWHQSSSLDVSLYTTESSKLCNEFVIKRFRIVPHLWKALTYERWEVWRWLHIAVVLVMAPCSRVQIYSEGGGRG